jgi:hypothetical protein
MIEKKCSEFKFRSAHHVLQIVTDLNLSAHQRLDGLIKRVNPEGFLVTQNIINLKKSKTTCIIIYKRNR